MSNKAQQEKVEWRELFPAEFFTRLKDFPVAYIPIGLVEPHGQVCALGLDMFKAEAVCNAAARVGGGIVTPSLTYHIHECGPSARFMHEQVGEVNAALGSVGPQAFFHHYLHVLRAMQNSGFQVAVALSGHGGAHAADVPVISRLFEEAFGLRAIYTMEFKLVEDEFPGDHAGKYEVSMLMHLRPDLVDMKRVALEKDFGGRMALNPNSVESTPEYGRAIFEKCVERLVELSGKEMATRKFSKPLPFVTYEDVEKLWESIVKDPSLKFACLQPRAEQKPLPESSRWKSGEHQRL